MPCQRASSRAIGHKHLAPDIWHQTSEWAVWRSYTVENGIDLAVGVEKSRLAPELHDLADDDDILANIRVKHVGGDAGRRYGLHCEDLVCEVGCRISDARRKTRGGMKNRQIRPKDGN